MPELATTAETGTTTPDLKTGIGYSLGVLEGDFKQEYTQNSSSVVVLCTVTWEDSDLFLAEMLGYSKKVGSQLQRVLPEKSGWDNPDKTDEVHYALDARLVKITGYVPVGATIPDPDDPESTIEFEGDPSGWPTFSQLTYAVTFGAPLYKVLEDDEVQYEHERFTIWTDKGQAQNEKIPGGGFKFPSDDKPLNEVGVRTGRTVALTAKWLDVPAVNRPKLSELSNKINDGPITFDGITYEDSTVLFETYSTTKRVNAFGRIVVDVEFNYLVRTDGRTWNMFWRVSGGVIVFEEPTTGGSLGGDKVYQKADLNQCFSIA